MGLVTSEKFMIVKQIFMKTDTRDFLDNFKR